MVSPVKNQISGIVHKEEESVSSNRVEDNKEEKMEEDSSHKSEPEIEMHESKNGSSDDSDTKFPKRELLHTETMDDIDSNPTGGKLLNIESVDNAGNKSSKNECIEIKMKDPDDSHPEQKLIKTEMFDDPNIDPLSSKNYENKDKDCVPAESKSVKTHSIDNQDNASVEVSGKYFQQNPPQEIPDNDSSNGDSFQINPVPGPSTESNPISDDTDNSDLVEKSNLTDCADVSDTISDPTDLTLRVQRKTKKKTKTAIESENESVEESRVVNPNPYTFLPIRHSSSNEAESTTTDDMRVTPFEAIGLEKTQRKSSPSSSEYHASSEDDGYTGNPETTDDASETADTYDGQSSENHLENSETSDASETSLQNKYKLEMLDDQSLVKKFENPETPNVQSCQKKPDHPETPDDQSFAKKSDIRQTTDESRANKPSDNSKIPDDDSAMDTSDTYNNGSVVNKSDSPEAGDTEGSRAYISKHDMEVLLSINLPVDKPLKSKKRKLSTIYEETPESGKDAKRLRSDEETD